mmetsp:Transcript_66899/g.156828  ORF Transcript_66899/g.156828 Transcript_66899/m.156828 type:complete len:226 (-) Transcript_66899:446-1123(-)
MSGWLAFFAWRSEGLRPLLSWNSFSTVVASTTAFWASWASLMVAALASFSLPRISVALAMDLSSCRSSSPMVTMSSPKEISEALSRSMSAFSSSTRIVFALRVFSLDLSSEVHQVCCSESVATSLDSLVIMPSTMSFTPSRDPLSAGWTKLRRAALWRRWASFARKGTTFAFSTSLLGRRSAAKEEPCFRFTWRRLLHFTSSRDNFWDTTVTAFCTACSSSLRIF